MKRALRQKNNLEHLLICRAIDRSNLHALSCLYLISFIHYIHKIYEAPFSYPSSFQYNTAYYLFTYTSKT